MPRILNGNWGVRLLWLLLVGLAPSVSVASVTVDDAQQTVSLEGEWKFHPGDQRSWADPDFDDSNWVKLDVPEPWGRQGYSGLDEFAWYRREIRVEAGPRTSMPVLGILIGKVANSYEFFADGRLLGGVGSVPPHLRIDYDQHAIYEVPAELYESDGRVVIALRVWKSPMEGKSVGGLGAGPYAAGPPRTLLKQEVLDEAVPIVLAALFLITGVYHLYLFSKRRELFAYLWFALFAIVVSGYVFLRTQWKYELGLDFVLMKKFEYALMYVTPPLYLQFLWPLLTQRIGTFLRTYQWANVVLAGVVLVVPGMAINLYTLPVWQFAGVCMLLATPPLVIREIYRGNEEAQIVGLGILVMVAAALWDTAHTWAWVVGPRFIHLGFAAFVFSMALSLANRFTRVYREMDTLSRELEERVKERTSELSDAYARLKELDEAKTRFFAGVSHELRTPLTMVLGPISTILNSHDPSAPAWIKDRLEMIHRNAAGLLERVNDLLDFSRAQTGKLELEAERMDAAEPARQVVAGLQAMADSQGISLQVRAAADPSPVALDRNRTILVLRNLVHNAIKYTSAGGAVQVSVDSSENEVQYRISDTGTGLSEEELSVIFDSFHQSRRPPDDDEQTAGSLYRHRDQGLGLGLTLCRDVVALCGGSIEVDSQPNEGSTFTVLLPSLDQDDVQLRPARTEPDRVIQPSLARQATETEHIVVGSHDDGGIESSGNRLTTRAEPPDNAPSVLVVEDEPDLQRFIEDILVSRYHVSCASDGAEGIKAVTDQKPDLVIADVMLPERSGFELVEEVRKSDETRHIPIILVTALVGQKPTVEGLKKGANDYVHKPFDPRELLARVDATLRVTALERQLAELNRNLEEKVEERTAELQETHAALRRAEKLSIIGKMAAGLAHDLKTPMIAIQGYAEVLGSSDLDDQSAQFVSHIERSAQRLLDMVDDVLAYARDEVKVQPTSIPPRTFFHDLREVLDPYFSHARIDFEIRGEGEGRARFDPNAMRRVLFNLAWNAREAMTAGDRRFEIRWELNEHLVITCSDTGPGVPVSIEDDLFRDFVTADKEGGTGLGLAVSKRLVEAHKGTIHYESAKGGGAKFVVTLPRS